MDLTPVTAAETPPHSSLRLQTPAWRQRGGQVYQDSQLQLLQLRTPRHPWYVAGAPLQQLHGLAVLAGPACHVRPLCPRFLFRSSPAFVPRRLPRHVTDPPRLFLHQGSTPCGPPSADSLAYALDIVIGGLWWWWWFVVVVVVCVLGRGVDIATTPLVAVAVGGLGRAGTLAARQNVKNFLAWAKTLQLDNLFEPDDLCKFEDEDRIVWALYDVARRTRCMRVPKLVWLERLK